MSKELNTIKKRWELYSKLPKDAKDMLFSNTASNAIYNIAKTEHILPKISRLAEITGDVMLGLLPITKFRKTIQKELSIEEEKARRIAQAIRSRLFMAIAESLRKIHKLK